MSVQPVDDKKAEATMTQLLTLVNVSASAPGKRKYALVDEDGDPSKKRVPLNRRGTTPTPDNAADATAEQPESAAKVAEEEEEDKEAQPQQESAGPSYDSCFSSLGPRAKLAEGFPKPADETPFAWTSTSTHGASGTTQSLLVPDWQSLHTEVNEDEAREVIAPLVPPTAQPSARQCLRSYADLVDCTVTPTGRKKWRDTVAAHVMEHVLSTRATVTKNNELLARAADEETDQAEPDSDAVRDQGFTRPKVLILVPLRNSAYAWKEALAKHSRCTTIDSQVRFEKEYALPEGVEDKLLLPQVRSKYPAEHVATFAGNIDDSFKLGMKVTRKTFKLFSGWYESDVIMASPLGLRLLIDQDDSADFLSSIEMLVMDQTDVMVMQNWEHVKYVLSRMNTIPQESHQTDFARVKSWYLEDKSRLFRQSIISAPYVLPEVLNVFNKNLLNLSGKRFISRETSPAMKSVRSGIRQTFVRFECADPQREPELRFNVFTTKLMPNLMRSAVSANHVLLFVPSYFDFLRVEQYLMGREDVSFAAISEYSTTKQITRAREQFFTGKKSILLLTERFHFYKRYRLRGAQTIVFYGLPENPAFFSEVLEFPFNRKEGKASESDPPPVEPNEVKVEALFCRYDLLKLRRIVGPDAQKLLSEDKAMWKFS